MIAFQKNGSTVSWYIVAASARSWARGGNSTRQPRGSPKGANLPPPFLPLFPVTTIIHPFITFLAEPPRLLILPVPPAFSLCLLDALLFGFCCVEVPFLQRTHIWSVSRIRGW